MKNNCQNIAPSYKGYKTVCFHSFLEKYNKNNLYTQACREKSLNGYTKHWQHLSLDRGIMGNSLCKK